MSCSQVEKRCFTGFYFLFFCVTAPSVDVCGMRRSNMPHMLKESSSGLVCLHGCSRTVVIAITCLYTAGSSIRESPTSACQHINLHKCIYHATCMLCGKYICTYCSCLSRQHKQEAEISAFQFNVEWLKYTFELVHMYTASFPGLLLITFQWESLVKRFWKPYLKNADFIFFF